MESLVCNGGKPVIKDKVKYSWPIITEETKEAVLNQLNNTISIYNRSGIIEEFEDEFAKLHNRTHALLTNSGTSALFGLYEGLELKPGDEVIVPTYTFFATISPLIYTGAKPVFCDCTKDGNIDPFEIAKKITSKTKAIMVTHMWGIPCEMDKIIQIAKNKSIPLLEDCSHSHGAMYKGQITGSFGEGAAWSLQGAKIVSGGEGGILLTDNQKIFERALAQGHYNKRCKQEITNSSVLKDFELTGLGQKFRSHPIAIAIAKQQLSHLLEWQNNRNEYANDIINLLRKYDFLRMPNIEDRIPSWYSFVFNFIPEKANGLSVNSFFNALQAEGLDEVDQPGSTCPCHNLPLFVKPNKAMPRLYSEEYTCKERYPNADSFYKNAIKIPVWSFKNDKRIMEMYAQGIDKVCWHVKNNPSDLLKY